MNGPKKQPIVGLKSTYKDYKSLNSLSRDLLFRYLYNRFFDYGIDAPFSFVTSEGIQMREAEEGDDFISNLLETYVLEGSSLNLSLRDLSYVFKTKLDLLQTHLPEILEKIQNNLEKTRLQSLPLVTLAILCVASNDLLYSKEEESFKIIINDAVVMGKLYGNKDSYGFINGVLDKIK